jgi:hypothetical protein
MERASHRGPDAIGAAGNKNVSALQFREYHAGTMLE